MISFVVIENVIFSLIETINTYNEVSYAYLRQTRVFTICRGFNLKIDKCGLSAYFQIAFFQTKKTLIDLLHSVVKLEI